MDVRWRGVLPALTTPFDEDLNVDHAFLAEHGSWMIDEGCVGIVSTGSLGEAATLSVEEKVAIVRTLATELGGRAPVVPGVASLSTAEAVRFTKEAEAAGASGFMVLPPYVYSTGWREMKAHVAAIMRATELPCMLYNNPISYGTDFTPEQIAELAEEFPHLRAVKESSSDVRRVTAIRALIGDRLEICVGVDDAIVEGIYAGATGWIAGLVNAFPRESVALYNFAIANERQKTFELYRWFLPLLRLDVVPELVQLIKLAQQQVDRGNERVRGPRLAVEGKEREAALATIAEGLRTRPSLPKQVPAAVA